MTPLKNIFKKPHGFTLVELIVVITILVILGTIAFTSLGGYSTSARDSQRIENLANLKKGLDIFRIKTETYPLPENSISILSSGSTIGYQWFAKDQVASIAQISKGGTLDPSDATIYTTYSTNTNRTKMQAMVFLEDGSSVTSYMPSLFTPEALAAWTTDYTKRTPRVTGDTLGILLGNSGSTLNQPIQELYNAVSFTGVDVVTATGGTLNAYISNTTILSGTGPVLIPLITNNDSTITTYPGCDTKDIKLPNGQVWAACNVGATVAWTNQTFASSTGVRNASINTWAGGLYQWGNNADVSFTSTSTGQVVCPDIPNWVNSSVFKIPTPFSDWCTAISNDLWGDITAMSGDITASSLARQGPCAPGYRVPIPTEWYSAITIITGKTSWSGSERNILQNTLKLPMAGRRVYTTGAYNLEGTNGAYWSSYPTGNFAYSLVFYTSGITNPMTSSLSKAVGWSVRCIRN